MGYKILSTRNERGWDIPGGHVENSESLEAALERELLEEAGAAVRNPRQFALLTPNGNTKSMLFYTSNELQLGEFTSKVDALSREKMSVTAFLNKYHGDTALMCALIKKAQAVLKS